LEESCIGEKGCGKADEKYSQKSTE